MPYFSIIVPTYNHGNFIKRCINSVLCQSYSDWEMIIVNNYSDDDTIEKVKAFKDSRIKLINYRNNGIIAASRNRGIKEASGKWICFLDSDDWWYPEKLKVCFSEIQKEKSDVIYHYLDKYSKKGKNFLSSVYLFRQVKPPVFRDLMLKGNTIPNSGTCIRRSLIKRAGGLEPNSTLVGVEDYDLLLRLSLLTDRFKYIPCALGGYFKGDMNVSSADDKQINRRLAIYEKHSPLLSKEDQKKAYAFVSIGKILIYYKMGRYKDALISCIEAFMAEEIRIKLFALIIIFPLLMNVVFKNSIFRKKTI